MLFVRRRTGRTGYLTGEFTEIHSVRFTENILHIRGPLTSFKAETYRDTSSQVLFRRWMALHCSAERMALNEEKFFKIRHSWMGNKHKPE